MDAVCLVGFMGAGKTAVGRALADRLGWPLYDLDEEIETREGRSVYEIFAESGESYFRQKEREVLGQLAGGNMVLSVGGGAFTVDDNINLINKISSSVWLRCPIEICLQRLSSSAIKRPLFSDPTQMANLYQHRLKYYKRANHHVDGDKGTPAEIASEIMELLDLKAEQK